MSERREKIPSQEKICIDSRSFYPAVRHVAFSAAPEGSDWASPHLFIAGNNTTGKLSLLAHGGFRMSQQILQLEQSQVPNFDIAVSAQDLLHACRFHFSSRRMGIIALSISERRLVVQSSNTRARVILPINNVDRPNIPDFKPAGQTVTIDRKQTRDIIKGVKSRFVVLTPAGGNEISLRWISSEEDTPVLETQIGAQGTLATPVVLNTRFVKDLLTKTNFDTLNFSLVQDATPNSEDCPNPPAIFQTEDNSGYTHVMTQMMIGPNYRQRLGLE